MNEIIIDNSEKERQFIKNLGTMGKRDHAYLEFLRAVREKNWLCASFLFEISIGNMTDEMIQNFILRRCAERTGKK